MQKTIFKDIVPIYIDKSELSNSAIYFRVIIHSGMLEDGVGKYGLAHFLEHMLFNGSSLYPKKEEIESYRRVLFFDTLNATTGYNYTYISGKFHKDDFDFVFKFLNQLIFYPILKEEEIEREKKVITEEIWRRFENQKKIDLFQERNFIKLKDHKSKDMLSASGVISDILTITKEDLSSFHKKNYNLNNISLLLVGNISEDVILEKSRILFEGVEIGEKRQVLPPYESKLESSITHKISESQYFDLKGDSIPKQTTINYGFILDRNIQEEVIDLISDYLKEILMDKLRYYIGSTYNVSVGSYTLEDYTYFGIHTKINPLNLDKVLDIINSSLDDLKNNKLDIKILKEVFDANLKLIQTSEITSGRMIDDYNDYLINKKEIKTLKECQNNYEKIDLESIGYYFHKFYTHPFIFINTP